MKLTLLGAARTVTGSCTLLECGNSRILVDCGYFQERKFQKLNWNDFPVPPASIDVLLLTHAHLDHCGRIPRLVAQGFRGRILSTDASADIARIVMLDSARIQEEDLRQKQKRHEREKRRSPYPYEALYTVEDAERAVSQFEPLHFEEKTEIAPGVFATWYESGHILGAASIRVEHEGKSVLFSGDLGRSDMPILRDPVPPPGADVVLLESTYGNRDHAPNDHIPDQLADVINRTHKEGGNLIIPSFAVERSQDILYHFSQLLAAKRIPPTLVFLDSPMAVRVTEVFRRNRELFDDETWELIEQGLHPTDFPGLQLSRSRDQSKAINRIRGSVCVIAGSGMCTGGRIKHHLAHNISRPESCILFVGYQAPGTLGRQILEEPDEVRIMGRPIPLRARIEQLQGFSGHADRSELSHWLKELNPPPKRILLNHGEEEVSLGFAEELNQGMGIPVEVPRYEETLEI